jgi:hypothetical protein
METQTELRNALDKAKATRARRDDIKRKLNKAITDADASMIIEYERAAGDIEAEVFAAELELYKAKINEADARRAAATNERAHLENILKGAAAAYARQIEVADELRQRLQLVQAQLFGADNRIESAREELNAFRDELKVLAESRIGGNN